MDLEEAGLNLSIHTSGESFHLFESFHLSSLEKCDNKTYLQGCSDVGIKGNHVCERDRQEASIKVSIKVGRNA